MRALTTPLLDSFRAARVDPRRARSAYTFRRVPLRQDTARNETSVVQAVDVFAQNRLLYEQIGKMETTQEELVHAHECEVQALKMQSEEAYHEIYSLRELIKQLDFQLEEEHRASYRAYIERENVKYGILQRQINLQRYNKYYAQCYTAVNMQVLAAVVSEFAAGLVREIADQEIFDIIAELEAKIDKMEAKIRQFYLANQQNTNDAADAFDSEPFSTEGATQMPQTTPGGAAVPEVNKNAGLAEHMPQYGTKARYGSGRDESAVPLAGQVAAHEYYRNQ